MTSKNLKECMDELQAELTTLQTKIQRYILRQEEGEDGHGDKDDTTRSPKDSVVVAAAAAAAAAEMNTDDTCTEHTSPADQKIEIDLQKIENINHIPKLIKRIVQNEMMNNLTLYQNQFQNNIQMMIQLLSSIAIGFGQCFLYNLSVEKKTITKQHSKASTINMDRNQKGEYFHHQAEQRLYQWLADTIYELLHVYPPLPPPSASSSSFSSSSQRQYQYHHRTRIPVLDALIATTTCTGNHNGISHDLILQQLWNQCYNYDDDIIESNYNTYNTDHNGIVGLSSTFEQSNEDGNEYKDRRKFTATISDARRFCKEIVQHHCTDKDTNDNEHVNGLHRHHCEHNLFLEQIQSFLIDDIDL